MCPEGMDHQEAGDMLQLTCAGVHPVHFTRAPLSCPSAFPTVRRQSVPPRLPQASATKHLGCLLIFAEFLSSSRYSTQSPARNFPGQRGE